MFVLTSMVGFLTSSSVYLSSLRMSSVVKRGLASDGAPPSLTSNFHIWPRFLLTKALNWSIISGGTPCKSIHLARCQQFSRRLSMARPFSTQSAVFRHSPERNRAEATITRQDHQHYLCEKRIYIAICCIFVCRKMLAQHCCFRFL